MSKTAICNLALAALARGKAISNVETERSAEASACLQFFEIARDATLRDFPWPFATRIQSLALVTENPNSEWKYAYRYPVNCLSIRRFLNGIRPENQNSRVPYRVIGDDEGRLVLTDQSDAEVEFTARVEDVIRWPQDFVIALSFRLAAYIAPRITGGDNFKLGDRALKLYQYEISSAARSAANEEAPDVQPDAEIIRTRES